METIPVILMQRNMVSLPEDTARFELTDYGRQVYTAGNPAPEAVAQQTTRDTLINNITEAVNNLINNMERYADAEVVSGNALAEDLGRDEKGHHIRVTVDWWMGRGD